MNDQEHKTKRAASDYRCDCGRKAHITTGSGIMLCWRCYDRVKPKDWRDDMVDAMVKK